ncbi:universal stress protein [Blastococcus atacamensis]|uniref:universal stress protein n=1 Tax=Blastococcus atacamensis TaxID=2070508 RepID=UPI000CEC4B2B|nr:universal stress protein [Blastococcus atacamensis]
MTTPRGGLRAVLVGVDGSGASSRAVAVGTDEAQRRGLPLRLLTAATWRDHVLPGTEGGDVDLGGALRGGAEALLRDLAAEAAVVLGADRVSWQVAEGHPVDVLRAAAAQAPLVVVGTRGAGGVAGLRLGSTAGALVAAGVCPVLVVPDDTVVVRDRSSVVAGIEGRPEDEEVLAFAVGEALARGTDLVAVHAWQDVTLETAFRSLGPLVDWAGVLSDEVRVLSEALTGWREKEPGLVVREVVVRDRAAPALVSAALTAQLLVVGHRHRRVLARLGSTTSALLHRAGCPVAVVPVGSGS